MKHTVLILLVAASAAAAAAQTAPKAAAPSAATTVHHTATTTATSAVKLPPGVPPVKGIVKSAFTLRYEDIKLGAGADAEPGKMFKVLYTGYLGSNGRPDDGHKFDASDDHRQPVKDKDGKPVLGDDGRPKLGDPQPMQFPQGMGRLIPGFDQGFAGMKVGGKRRIFIPWQMAYGAKGPSGHDARRPSGVSRQSGHGARSPASSADARSSGYPRRCRFARCNPGSQRGHARSSRCTSGSIRHAAGRNPCRSRHGAHNPAASLKAGSPGPTQFGCPILATLFRRKGGNPSIQLARRRRLPHRRCRASAVCPTAGGRR